MRVLLAAGFVVSVVAASTPAQSVEYPWCVQYGGRTGGTNCGFVSWEQCRWTASGTGGFCSPNPFYAAQMQAAPRPKKRRAVHY